MALRKTSKTSPKTSKPSDGRLSPDVSNLKPIDRESLLNHIQATLPLPMRDEECSDGSVVFVGGDPGEVVVRVAQSRVTVSVFRIASEGLPTPVICPQPLMSLSWRRVPAGRLITILQGIIETAQQLRRSQYRKCERCGETKPPEWMHSTGGCQSCAQRGA